MQTLTKPLTYEEFREMDFSEEEEKAYIFELIAGEIVTKAYPTATHQTVLGELLLMVGKYLKNNELGKVYFGLFPMFPELTTEV